jgi:hypothetical protein
VINKPILRIAIFYSLALGISNTFRLHLFGYGDFEKQLSELEVLATYPLHAVGIVLGYLAAIYLMKKNKSPQYSLFGDSVYSSIALALIPIILIAVIGLGHSPEMNPHIIGMVAAISTLLYCYFEEIGWRGYLHDELSSIKHWQRALLIGFLWWFWHLNFLINDANVLSELIFLAILIASAWGLGKLIEHTKSILAVSSAHMIINILFLNAAFRQGMAFNARLIVVGVSVILFVIILVFWDKSKARKPNKKQRLLGG